MSARSLILTVIATAVGYIVSRELQRFLHRWWQF